MTATDEEKEDFYDMLNATIAAVPQRSKLILLGDLNARVGRDCAAWTKVLGHHGVGNENSNGTLLLQTCATHQLIVTNTVFQQADKHKNSWMHPRSKQWHLLDYVITRQRDIRDVRLTKAVRGSECWSDHRLICSIIKLAVSPPKRHRQHKVMRRLNVGSLRAPDVQQSLQEKLDTALEISEDDFSADEDWSQMKDVIYKAAMDVLGPQIKKHKDWFDDQDHQVHVVG